MMARRAAFNIDLVVLTALTRELAILVEKGKGERERWTLPWTIPAAGESLAAAVVRLGGAAVGARPEWLQQIGAFGDGRRHPAGTPISIGYVGAASHETAVLGKGFHWFPIRDLPPLSPRQRNIVEGGIAAVTAAVDRTPIAFRLLSDTFTLTELQQMYELLLGKQLHKASFRRALQAASLVEPTDEWRSEGRGRPAQLYQFGPKKRRQPVRGVRFDLIGGAGV